MTDLQRRVLKVQCFFPPREKYIQPGRAVTAQKKTHGMSNAWRPRTKLVVSGIVATRVPTANRGPKIGRCMFASLNVWQKKQKRILMKQTTTLAIV